jgi:hypothetical protein
LSCRTLTPRPNGVEPRARVLGLHPVALGRIEERDRLNDVALCPGFASGVVQRRRALGANLVVCVVEVRVAQVVVRWQRRELVDDGLGPHVEHDAADRVAIERVDDHAAGAERRECVGLRLAAGEADHVVARLEKLGDQELADGA